MSACCEHNGHCLHVWDIFHMTWRVSSFIYFYLQDNTVCFSKEIKTKKINLTFYVFICNHLVKNGRFVSVDINLSGASQTMFKSFEHPQLGSTAKVILLWLYVWALHTHWSVASNSILSFSEFFQFSSLLIITHNYVLEFQIKR